MQNWRINVNGFFMYRVTRKFVRMRFNVFKWSKYFKFNFNICWDNIVIKVFSDMFIIENNEDIS